MKSWKEYSKPERAMIVTLCVLVLLVILSSGRVNREVQKGISHFFSTPSDSTEQIK